MRPDTEWDWQRPGDSVPYAKVDVLLARGKVGRLAETYYRSGGVLTGSITRLKLANIADRLLLRPRPTIMLILSAEEGGKGDPAEALAAFRKAVDPLDQWMDRTARLR